MKKTIRVFHSFAEAEQADREYYRSLTPEQRLDILLDLDAQRWDSPDEAAKGFERVYRITQLGGG